MPIEAIQTVGSILFGSALTVLVAYLLGRLLLSRYGPPPGRLGRAEGWLFAFGIGAAGLSNLVFLLCAAGLVYDGVFLGLAAAVAAACLRWSRPVSAARWTSREPRRRFWQAILVLTGICYGCLYLAHSLAPEVSADGAGYHLGLVSRYYLEHGFPRITTNIYAFLSQGAEMLYLFAYAFGRHSAAKMTHFSFLVAAAAAMLAFAHRYRVWRAGAAGVVLYACSPVVGLVAASSYNDCALAFYLFLTFYALLLWWEQRDGAWLWIVGVLAGFCFSVKYTGGIAVPAVLAVVSWGSWRRLRNGRTACARVLAVAAAASLFILPWTIKNAIWAGNPFAPLFNQIFPNPYVTPAWETQFLDRVKHYSASPPPRWRELLEAPLELTVRGTKLEGLLGPVYLLAPAALLAWRRRLTRLLVAAAFIAALPWLANAGSRFLIPSLVFVSLAMGLALYRIPGRAALAGGCLILLFHALSSWPTILPKWYLKWRPEGVVSLRGVPWRAALRLEPEEEYLSRYLPRFKTAKILDREAGPHTRVLSLEPLPEAYFDAELLVAYQGAENQQLAQGLLAVQDPDLWPIRSLRLRWPSRLLQGFRIVQTSRHPASHWMISEIRLFDADSEIVPQTDWRIRADPFPWAAARAFDGDPATAWTTWQPLDQGMSIDVRFPRPLLVSGAEIIYPWGQHFARFESFGRDPSGGWFPLEAESAPSRRPVSADHMRASAVDQLRRHGIEFLVTNTAGGGYNAVAPLIAENPAAWSLEEIGRDGPVRIYRVK